MVKYTIKSFTLNYRLTRCHFLHVKLSHDLSTDRFFCMADLRRTDNHNVQYLQWLYLCVCLLYGIASVNRWFKTTTRN